MARGKARAAPPVLASPAADAARAVAPAQTPGLLLRGLCVLGLLLFCFAVLAVFAWLMPTAAAAPCRAALQRQPDMLTGMRTLLACFRAYEAANPVYLVGLFVWLYITLQAFAIPGSLWLSILAGALWGPARGAAVVTLCATLGPSACYLLSALVAAPLVEQWMPDKLTEFRARVVAEGPNLFWWMVAMRLSPFV